VKLLNKTTRCGLFLLPLLLTGCGAVLNPYHENFNCQAPKDAGHCVDTPSAYDEAVGTKQPLKGEAANPEKQIESARLDRLAQLLKEPKTPMIVPPRILRVLILPYKGGEDLFMTRYAYLQVDSARWVLTGIEEDAE
jgi:conjugal transfer pilus assembly protein TraV